MNKKYYEYETYCRWDLQGLTWSSEVVNQAKSNILTSIILKFAGGESLLLEIWCQKFDSLKIYRFKWKDQRWKSKEIYEHLYMCIYKLTVINWSQKLNKQKVRIKVHEKRLKLIIYQTRNQNFLKMNSAPTVLLYVTVLLLIIQS